jgi:diguanylate cyclase (GGDEF)-like protein/PAS domain S-box-containing protein
VSNIHESVLVVDDQEMNRDMLGRRLEIEGYAVAVAEGGRQAIELLEKQSFDLVLLDVMMPEMSGLEVLSRLRAQFSKTELPVIIVTAKGQSEDMVAAFALEANDYVTKPIDMQVAMARIANQLSGKRAVAALRESEMRYSLAARGANDGLWDWDLRSNEVYYSPRWKEMLGYGDEEIGNSVEEWLERVHPHDLERVQAALENHRQGMTTHFETEHRMRHKDATYRWVLSRGLSVRDSEGRQQRMAGSQTDITRGKAIDELTGLPNRALFLDRLQLAIDQSQRDPGYLYAILFLDVDRFKVINDSLGHLAGDQLLVALSARLEASLRACDFVARTDREPTAARFGGDEFAILLEGIAHPDNAGLVARRLLDAVSRPFTVNGHDIFTGVSIGIAPGDASYRQAEDILRDADTAMYHAKADGKGRYVTFDAEMRTAAIARLTIETELRRAIEREEFRVHYQPIVSLDTYRITGFEALLRWQHPERGLVPPAEFIGVAEEAGLITTIGLWVLRAACRQMAAWQVEYPQCSRQMICVKVSAIQFTQPTLFDEVARILDETGLNPRCLKLEITEGVLVDDPKHAVELLTRLRALGVQIGVDDFGTGYSSLSYLEQFPIDTLKVDRSFVSRLGTSNESNEIIQTIVNLAHNLKIDVVAEGVEQPGQAQWLRGVDCEFGQGYLFSKPVPSEAAGALLAAEGTAAAAEMHDPPQELVAV